MEMSRYKYRICVYDNLVKFFNRRGKTGNLLISSGAALFSTVVLNVLHPVVWIAACGRIEANQEMEKQLLVHLFWRLLPHVDEYLQFSAPKDQTPREIA